MKQEQVTNSLARKFFDASGALSRKFSGYELRPQQVRMVEAVTEALTTERHLMVEAGTGTGKTLAYLVPALLSGKKIVISTGTKNLQEQIFYKDIVFLREKLGRNFKAVLMKGKSNYLCRYRFGQFSVDPLFPHLQEAHHFPAIVRWAETTDTGDRSEWVDLPENIQVWQEISVGEGCLGSKCPDYNPCFITRLRQEAAEADLIIVNHHLFFADLSLRESSYGQILPRYDAVIFDEAHKIEEVATQHFGLSVSNYRLEELVRDAFRELRGLPDHAVVPEPPRLNPWEALLHSLSKASEAFFDSLRILGTSETRATAGGTSPGQRSPREESKKRLKPSDLGTEQKDTGNHLAEALSALTRRLQGGEMLSEGAGTIARRALEIRADLICLIEEERHDWVSWMETRGRGVFLQASPLDLTASIKDALLNRVPSLVFTSATLSVNRSLEYFKSRIGLEGAEELVLDSPFDFANQALLYLPGRSPDPNTPGYIEFLSREIPEILSATGGRAFVLFTSYRNLEQVYTRCRNLLKFPLLKQGDKPRSSILKEFRENIPSVLFATSSFWEGVDVPGESLSCVIIDRLPFASPRDPLVEARMEYLQHQGKDPFYDYQVPEAVLSLKQGLGRLIRSRSDRGVMAILDGRVHSRSYGKVFLNSLPPCPVTSEIGEIQRFLR
jgi:ATP-dependent DNA helicase DinG